jgi:hypothetical protein
MCAPVNKNLEAPSRVEEAEALAVLDRGEPEEDESEGEPEPEPVYPRCFMCGDTTTPGRVSVPPTYEVICMQCSAERLQPAQDSVMRTFEEALRYAEATRQEIMAEDPAIEERLLRERRRVARREAMRFIARRSIRRADARIAAFRAARR